MKILFVLLMLLVSSVANAEVPCDADPQAHDPSSCGTARYMVAFRQLEEALQLAVDALSALASSNAPYEHSVAILMEAQQFWKQYALKDCDVHFAADPIVASHNCGFNRSTQQIADIVRSVFHSLTSSWDVRSIVWPPH